MTNLKTREEALELLKAGRTLKYFYLSGGVVFSGGKDGSIDYITSGDFLRMRRAGIIDCDSSKKTDVLGSREKYQEYFWCKL